MENSFKLFFYVNELKHTKVGGKKLIKALELQNMLKLEEKIARKYKCQQY